MENIFVDINMTPRGIAPRIHVSQYDRGRIIECFVYTDSTPYVIPEGCLVTVEGTKADNKGFQYECTYSGSNVYFEITDQMTMFEGEVETEIVVYEGDKRYGSANFILDVEVAGLKADVDISKTDLPILEQLPAIRNEVVEAKDSAEQSAEDAKGYRDEAEEIVGTSKEQIEEATAQGIESVSSTRDGVLSDIETARTGAISSIEGKETTVLENIGAKEETGLQSLETATITHLGELETKKTESIEEMEDYAKLSESWAKGETGVREGEDTANSKYYAERSKEYMEQASVIVDVGFASDTKSGLARGDGETVHADYDNGGRMSLTQKYAEHPDKTFYDNKVHGLNYDPISEALFLTAPDGSEIEIGGGGGGGAVLEITAPDGSNIKAEGAGKVYEGTGGTVRFKIKDYGTYTITATSGKKKAVRTVEIDTSKLYTETLTYWVASIAVESNLEADIAITPSAMADKSSFKGTSGAFEVYEANTYGISGSFNYQDSKGNIKTSIVGSSVNATAQKTYDVPLHFNKAHLKVNYPSGSTFKATINDLEYSGANEFDLYQMGQYTLTITDGEQTATQYVNISDGDDKEITLAYFNATITVTHARTLNSGQFEIIYGVDGSYTSVSANKNGTTVINVPKTGVYSVNVKSNGSQQSEIKTASITAEGQDVPLNFEFSSISISYPTGGTLTLKDANGTDLIALQDGPAQGGKSATFMSLNGWGEYSASVVDGEKSGELKFDVSAGANITKTISYFSATITVSYPDGATATFKEPDKQAVTLTQNPQIFTVYKKGDYTATATSDTEEDTQTVTVTDTQREFNIELAFIPTKSFSDCTDEELVKMVQASNEGKIDLSQYWAVGQERTIHLSAMSGIEASETHAEQDTTWVLMNEGGKEYADGSGEVAFIVGMKDCLATRGKMNTTSTNVGGWKDALRRDWCNNTFKNAIPSVLHPIFKPYKHIVSKGSTSSSQTATGLNTVEDYFGFPVEMEIMGVGKNSAIDEQSAYGANSQLEWYKTNRIKKTNGTTVDWWCSSSAVNYSVTSAFMYISTSGAANSMGGSNIGGLSLHSVLGTKYIRGSIKVTYPTDATECTLYKGSDPIASADTNPYTFTNLMGGTYTVVISNDDNEIRKEVKITENGQLVEVNQTEWLTIVSWANGTPEQIKAMLDAYYNDAITLSDMGWMVGDTRIIHLDAMKAAKPNDSVTMPAQDIAVTIVTTEHHDLATPINGHTKACITVQTREVLHNGNSGSEVYIDGNTRYDTSFTKWANLYMREYLNGVVWDAFPNDAFKSAIKQSKHYRHTAHNTSASENVTDTLFLPSYPEVFGTAQNPNYTTTYPTEGIQFEYYKASSNRTKYTNNNGAPSKISNWWTGSPSLPHDSTEGYYWYSVTSGSASVSNGNMSKDLAPTWCM